MAEPLPRHPQPLFNDSIPGPDDSWATKTSFSGGSYEDLMRTPHSAPRARSLQRHEVGSYVTGALTLLVSVLTAIAGLAKAFGWVGAGAHIEGGVAVISQPGVAEALTTLGVTLGPLLTAVFGWLTMRFRVNGGAPPAVIEPNTGIKAAILPSLLLALVLTGCGAPAPNASPETQRREQLAVVCQSYASKLGLIASRIEARVATPEEIDAAAQARRIAGPPCADQEAALAGSGAELVITEARAAVARMAVQ